MFKSIVAATALAGVLGLAGQALADDRAAPARAVSTAGVDFRSEASVTDFYHRLDRAAWAVCDTYAANSRVTQGDRACAEVALARTVKTLDKPMLTAVHDAQHGRSGEALALRADR